MIKKYNPRKPLKLPDIAFWFDEKDPTFYYLKIRKNVSHVSLLLASFDLLVEAIKSEVGTVVGEKEE